MTPSEWFSIANPLSLLGWLLLGAALFAPGSRWRHGLLGLGGRALPLLLSGGYVAALVASWGSAPGGGFGSLDQVATLFRSPGVLLAGWIHYLAFDLFIGRWIVDDALLRGPAAGALKRVLLLPVLLLTFMFGPAGLLSWFALRGLFGQTHTSAAGHAA